MAKTGFEIDYIVRDEGADLSDLLAIHQSVFPGNRLALWKQKGKVIVKVSNHGEVSGKTLAECKSEISWVEPPER